MKAIDAHAHLVQYIAGTGAGGELRFIGDGQAEYASGEKFRMLPECYNDGVVSPERLIELMDANAVDKAVLLQGNYFGFQNLYSMDAVKKYPDRFTAAASYDPYSRNVADIKKHLFEELGFPIVKFELSTGSGLMSNHYTMPVDDPILMTEYDYADDHNLVCVMDIGKAGSPSWQIPAIKNVIKRHPDMIFVVCHLLAPAQATEGLMAEGLKELVFPNVYFDIAALPHNARPDTYPYPHAMRMLKTGIDIVGADHIMFGSDVPSVLKDDSYEELLNFLRESKELSEDDKKLMLYDVAEMVYFGN